MNNGNTHDFTGMTFVITGGTRGIGAATAEMAAGYGADVVISGTNADAGEEVVATIAANGGSAAFVACDVTDPDQVEHLMAAAADTFGGIDVLHNNAGVHESSLTTALSIEDMGIDVWDHVLAVNLRGPWLCSKFAVPYLRRSERNPSVINTGSVHAMTGNAGSLAYGPSKGGLTLLTKNLAVELAPYGIRANCVCPASVETDMVATYLAGAGDKEAALDALTGPHLVPRLGRPEEIARVVCFLASEQSCFVNGVDWLVDGGCLAWRGTNSAA